MPPFGEGLVRIADLERKVGYSRRYLELLFKKHVGLSPMTLAAIFRFQGFYRRWAVRRPYAELRDELYDGCADQAHFVREFKRMTGHSPRAYFREIGNELGRQLSLHEQFAFRQERRPGQAYDGIMMKQKRRRGSLW